MANTYHQIYLHVIFAVKYRNALIDNLWKDSLFGIRGRLINENGGKLIIVNGLEDHIHCCLSLKPSISVADHMLKIKSNSSKWINDQGICSSRFEWQSGYGAFSVSRSHIKAVFNYIKNQEEHHYKRSFREEYLELLKKYNVDFDERYIFDDPV